MLYKNHIPKSMLATKILQLIDKNLDNFKHWGCDFKRVKSPCYCKNKDPITRYVCTNYIHKYSLNCKYTCSKKTNINV